MQRVGWSINFPPEVLTEYMGEKLGKFYTDPDTLFRVQVESRNLLNEMYALAEPRIVSASGGLSYTAASTMGAEIEFSEDSAPQIRNRKFSSIDEACEAQIPDIRCAGVVPVILDNFARFKEKARGTDIAVLPGIGAQGPFTTAVILRGMEFFSDLVLEPEKSKRFLDVCTEANLQLVKMTEELHGVELSTISVSDDYGGLVSPSMYEEFVLPNLLHIFDFRPGARRFFHCETLGIGHLRFLRDLRIDLYDPGVDERLSVEALKENTDVRFTYNLFTVRDMLRGTPDSIRKQYLEAVAQGAPEITTEICRGTPPENIHAYLQVAREFE